MKKMLRIAAALAALLAMTNFIGCKNDDDDESGNGLENTYWVMGDISTDVVENVSLTLKKGMYVHIEDSSKGSVYEADVENLDYSTLDFPKTNSVDISYSSEKQPFTYVVDGSKITVTSKYTDEDGKEQTTTFEATLAADKKSFTTTEINDGKEVSVIYTRIDKAPAKATLVITVTGGSTGGTTGGETGTTTGFENTYWVLEKTSFEESGLKVTFENLEYIYIKDSTSGSLYAANPEGVIKGLSESSVGTHNLDYEEPITFTYTVDGSNVTIKVGEETITAVIAADKNSFSITKGSEAHAYTKATAAPTQATVTVEVTAAPSETHTLDASSIAAFAANVKTDGQEESLDDYFTAIWSASTKVDASSKAFSDGYTGTQRINFGGKMLKNKNAIKFTTKKAATVKIWWAQGGDDNRQIGIASATDYSGTDQNTVVATNETLAKNAACISTLELSDAGTWILGGVTNKNFIFKIEVTE